MKQQKNYDKLKIKIKIKNEIKIKSKMCLISHQVRKKEQKRTTYLYMSICIFTH